jgi:plastocyanin
MRVRITLVLLAALAACSSSTSNTDPNPTPDAPGSTPSDAAPPRSDASPPIDAPQTDAPQTDASIPPPTVVAVTCPATPAGAITALDSNNTAYIPSSVTITVGQIVKFTMPSSHDVEPNPTMSDPGLSVGFGQTKCLMFNHTGTFGFHCGPHQFTGTVVVQ